MQASPVRSAFVIAVALIMIGLPLHAQTDPLAAARAQWEQADTDLNAVYKQLREKLAEHEFAALRHEQRRWIAYRDYFSGGVLIRDHPDITRDNLLQQPEHWQQMASITQERTGILRAILDHANGNPVPWTGRWTDGCRGRLLILEQGDELKFEIIVARGPTHHTGSIAGSAPFKNHLARFDDGRATAEGGPTWLTFIKKQPQIELHAVRTQYYHGARAYFDGTYYRVGELTQEERQRLAKSTKTRELDK